MSWKFLETYGEHIVPAILGSPLLIFHTSRGQQYISNCQGPLSIIIPM